MRINCDLEHELDLHNLLKHWAQNGVSAQQRVPGEYALQARWASRLLSYKDG